MEVSAGFEPSVLVGLDPRPFRGQVPLIGIALGDENQSTKNSLYGPVSKRLDVVGGGE